MTADEGDIGRGHMQRFQDVETTTPVILTTSQLLTTGLDAPTCKNIVLARLVNSMTEFKQIIGRGTRVRDDYGKLWFNIIDYTGSATKNFADPAFDGDPVLATQEEIDEYGRTIAREVVEREEPGSEEDGAGEEGGPIIIEPPTGQRRKYYFDGGQVEIATQLVYELDPDGKQLRVVKFTDYTAEKVRTLCTNAADLRRKWLDHAQRQQIIEKLAQRGIEFESLASQAGQPEAEPLDLLCHLAFNSPLRTRRERAEKVKRDKREFFEKYTPEASAILGELLEKYAEHGAEQLVLPEVLRVPPISEHGQVQEITKLFGGVDALRAAVNELEALVYAA